MNKIDKETLTKDFNDLVNSANDNLMLIQDKAYQLGYMRGAVDHAESIKCDGLRVNVWKKCFGDVMAQTPGIGEGTEDCNATLIIDQGVLL